MKCHLRNQFQTESQQQQNVLTSTSVHFVYLRNDAKCHLHENRKPPAQILPPAVVPTSSSFKYFAWFSMSMVWCDLRLVPDGILVWRSCGVISSLIEKIKWCGAIIVGSMVSLDSSEKSKAAWNFWAPLKKAVGDARKTNGRTKKQRKTKQEIDGIDRVSSSSSKHSALRNFAQQFARKRH